MMEERKEMEDRIGKIEEAEERREDVRREWRRIYPEAYPEAYSEEVWRTQREEAMEGIDGCVRLY